MKTFPHLNVLFASVLSTGLVLCGCHGNQPQQVSANSTPADQPSSNPATANLAPVAYTGTAPAPEGPTYPSGATSSAQNYPPQDNYPGEYDGEYSSQGDDTADESYYGVEPVDTATEPPPPLPQYDQPPCPGDDYLWTPGYWDYASTGYYWVPGVWVEAPYVGALWTPGYWGYSRGHYAFFHGYWGPHIGFYGGINYGFGYTGVGYQGGYWNGGRFAYNRAVNNVNGNVVHNVYNRTVINNTTIVNNNRMSYNGGRGGIEARPRPAELAALREPHAAPMQTQVAVQRSASENQAQFASMNHGRPAEVADTRPVAAARGVRPAASTSIHNLPMSARPPMTARNDNVPANRPAENQGAPNRQQANPVQPNRPEMNQPQANRPGTRPEEQPNRPLANNPPRMQTEPGRQEQYRPAQPPNVAHTAPNRPEPQQPRQEMQPNRPAPQQSRPEMPSRPQAPEPNRPPSPEPNRQAQIHPAPRQDRPAAPENRPAPQPSRPAPEQNHAAPPANHPAPAHNPPPEEHKDEHHPQ